MWIISKNANLKRNDYFQIIYNIDTTSIFYTMLKFVYIIIYSNILYIICLNNFFKKLLKNVLIRHMF